MIYIAHYISSGFLLELIIQYGDVLGYITSNGMLYYFLLSPRGYWVSLVAAGIAIASFFGTLLHLSSEADEMAAIRVINLFAFFTLYPLAVIYGAKLHGFLTVVALMGAFGFTVQCEGLCWCIGFTEKGMVQRAASSAALTILGYTALRLIPSIPAIYLLPFHSGVYVMANVTLLVALLIVSSKYYTFSDKLNREITVLDYVYRQVLILAIVGANVLTGIPSAMHTATVFLGLYLSTKLLEVVEIFGQVSWMFIFLISVGVIGACLYWF